LRKIKTEDWFYFELNGVQRFVKPVTNVRFLREVMNFFYPPSDYRLLNKEVLQRVELFIS